MINLKEYQRRLDKIYGKQTFKVLKIIHKQTTTHNRIYLDLLLVNAKTILVKRADNIQHLHKFLQESKIVSNPTNPYDYYQKKIDLIFPRDNIKLLKIFFNKRKHNKDRLFLKVYIPFHHQLCKIRCDCIKQLFNKTIKYQKSKINYFQKKLNIRCGKNTYTVLNIIKHTPNTRIILRHNTPKCGYHISSINSVCYINNDTVPCKWCRQRHNHSLSYYRFKIGKEYNGQYSCLKVKRSHKFGTSEYRILVRHNNQSCNYYTFWVESSSFFNLHTKCRKCMNKVIQKLARQRNKISFYKTIFNRYDNHNGQYLPAEQFKGHRTHILWWHMTYHPHLFKMTPEDYQYRNGKCPCQTNSNGEALTISWLKEHGFIKNKDYTYGLIISKGPLLKKHIDISFKNLPIWIEIDGLQHVEPWGRNIDNARGLIKVRRNDKLKNKYAPYYHKHLIRIRAYKICSTGFYKSLFGKKLQESIKYQLNKKLLPLLRDIKPYHQLQLF